MVGFYIKSLPVVAAFCSLMVSVILTIVWLCAAFTADCNGSYPPVYSNGYREKGFSITGYYIEPVEVSAKYRTNYGQYTSWQCSSAELAQGLYYNLTNLGQNEYTTLVITSDSAEVLRELAESEVGETVVGMVKGTRVAIKSYYEEFMYVDDIAYAASAFAILFVVALTAASMGTIYKNVKNVIEEKIGPSSSPEIELKEVW
jgi:hypothetical protein